MAHTNDTTPSDDETSPEPTNLNEEGLNQLIERRRNELREAGTTLANAAQTLSLFSTVSKVVLIFLGAFVATREVANQLIGTSSVANIVIYTLVGLFIAVLAGIEAAFKWENKSADMKALAATTRKIRRDTASESVKIFGSPTRERLVALAKLLDKLDDDLDDIEEKAATFGINVAREIKASTSAVYKLGKWYAGTGPGNEPNPNPDSL